MENKCWTCGTPISPADTFEVEYQHCRGYCCGCCPSKNGYRGESCQKDYIDRQKGKPVGFVESMNQ